MSFQDWFKENTIVTSNSGNYTTAGVWYPTVQTAPTNQAVTVTPTYPSGQSWPAGAPLRDPDAWPNVQPFVDQSGLVAELMKELERLKRKAIEEDAPARRAITRGKDDAPLRKIIV